MWAKNEYCNHCGSNFVPLLLFVAPICLLISLVMSSALINVSPPYDIIYY